jgi:cyclic-di-GMP-binding protein
MGATGAILARSVKLARGAITEDPMAGEFSFDVVSDFDPQELRNALDQARREIATRFDFKGGLAEIVQEKDALAIHTDSELRAKSIRDLVESKAIRRSLSLKIFDWGAIEPAGGMTFRQRVELRRGLSDELGRKITKIIRDEFPKVKSQIQGDAVRVSAKAKDDLQKVIVRLRELDEAVPLQFVNYR